MDCARKTIAADGIGALWKGFGPAMARAFPANAATFVSHSAIYWLSLISTHSIYVLATSFIFGCLLITILFL
jgi:hypothetical protein